MTKEVKRYGISGFGGGMIEMEDGAFYHEDDYAALEQECERLSNQRDAILLQARIWACEAKTQQSITLQVSEALGGIPTWGPIAATVTERLAERDAALLQVEALRELLAKLRQMVCATPENDLDQSGVWISTKHPVIKRIDAALQAKP